MRPPDDVCVDGRIILKLTLENYYVMVWTEFNWLWDTAQWRDFCEHIDESARSLLINVKICISSSKSSFIFYFRLIIF
jgi:hypothetical protein